MVRSPTLSVSSTLKPLTFITTAFPSSTHLTFPVSTTTPQPQVTELTDILVFTSQSYPNFKPSLLQILQSSHLQHQQCKARLSSLVCSAQTAISRRGQDSYDPELRLVLELATDSELYNLERILFGPSYFSPLLKSITNRADEIDFIMIGEDYEERQYFIELLEDRFFYLAADARFTLRGWRPTYRDTLLGVRRKLRIPCSSKLSTEDLEVEIFLHLLQDYSSGEADDPLENSSTSTSQDGLEYGLSQMKVHAVAALKGGAAELKSIVLKGGGIVTLAKIYQMLARTLSGKMLSEVANYQIKREIIKEGGKLAALNLESRAALLAARQGLAGAASRYLGLRSLMMLLGPMLWGTLLADVVIQMLGTDYARILRAIYAFAQIRITRTYKWASDKDRLV